MAAAPAKGRQRDAWEGAQWGVTFTIFAKYKKRILFDDFLLIRIPYDSAHIWAPNWGARGDAKSHVTIRFVKHLKKAICF